MIVLLGRQFLKGYSLVIQGRICTAHSLFRYPKMWHCYRVGVLALQALILDNCYFGGGRVALKVLMFVFTLGGCGVLKGVLSVKLHFWRMKLDCKE